MDRWSPLAGLTRRGKVVPCACRPATVPPHRGRIEPLARQKVCEFVKLTSAGFSGPSVSDTRIYRQVILLIVNYYLAPRPSSLYRSREKRVRGGLALFDG